MEMDNILNKIQEPSDLKKLSLKELEKLCLEIRLLLIETVTINGGHLASNLGVVELTVALHTILNSPKDKIIWDVGHQSYVHKILTGRKDKIKTIRKLGGISGFPNRLESEHDVFIAGHASTSISAALGIAKARELKAQNHSVFAVIGDGAMSGGLAFEAINNVASQIKGNFVVILNDNGMSISKPVGALSELITKIRTSSSYLNFKNKFERILAKIPKIGIPLAKKTEKLIERTRNMITDFKVGILFEELGFRYLGPIDGHNLVMLTSAISYAKKTDKPILLHVITKKGKGHLPCETDPVNFHGLSPYQISEEKEAISYSQFFGEVLTSLAQQDDKICAITPAMCEGSGLIHFRESLPDRFFDVGIAEAHALTFAAGLACQGLKPVLVIYSTFLQRAYDQLIHDICLQNLPVIFAIDRCGLVGEDGPTHHGVFDINFLRSIPNLTIFSPSNLAELEAGLVLGLTLKTPLAIRYPRKKEIYQSKQVKLIVGKSKIVKEQTKKNSHSLTIIAVGQMLKLAEAVFSLLPEFNITLINALFIKPLDQELILKNVKDKDLIVTIEDSMLNGGFGSAIIELLQDNDILTKVIRFGFLDKFIEHGKTDELYQKNGLEPVSITKKIKDALNY